MTVNWNSEVAAKQLNGELKATIELCKAERHLLIIAALKIISPRDSNAVNNLHEHFAPFKSDMLSAFLTLSAEVALQAFFFF